MRVIKFRAWDKKFNKMRYVSTIHFMPLNSSDKGKIASVSSSSRYIKMQDCELMQYAGLKDKNGKEIYEGDILLYPNGEKIAVIWMEYPASFSPSEETNATEVIGNICENPELLEGK